MEIVKGKFPETKIKLSEVSMVCVAGTNMPIAESLSKASVALNKTGVDVLTSGQCSRDISIWFVVKRKDFENAQLALHSALVEHDG